MALVQGKSSYRKWTVSTMNRRWADLNMGNVNPRPRGGEGAEGADRRRFWMIIFAQCSVNGWLPG